jgi:AcrR family transcriptional regulator
MTPAPSTRPTPTAAARTATSKRAETRRRVLSATIEMVAEVGVSGASAAAIAERSGLSWGVIQYHFGDRLGLFLAAFDDAIDGFERRQRDAAASATGSLAERVDHLLSQAWLQMTSAGYRGLLEIQLLLVREPAAASEYRAGTRRASAAAHDAWRSTFAELDPALVARVHDVALASMRGLAVSHALGTPTSGSAQARRDLAEATLFTLRG